MKPAGFNAGTKAAASYLLKLLESDGSEAVIAVLPRIHADVQGPFGHEASDDFGSFGFYSGVTNVAVHINHAYDGGGASAVESVLSALAR